MRKFQTLIQKVIRYRKVAVTTIFEQPIYTIEWVLFGTFRIAKYQSR